MSPLDIDPLSWIYGIPFALACFSFYRLPKEHRAKLELRKLFEYDSQVWSSLLARPVEYSDVRTHRTIQLGILVAASALSLLSLASLASFVLGR